MKEFLKKYGAYLVAALVFVFITIIYCFPALQGQVLSQSDNLQWQGMAHELKEYNATADTPANWTNSMFSGMPAYQITVKQPANFFSDIVWAVDRFFRALVTLFFNSILGLLMGYFIGFFVMLRCFGVNKWLSIVGSIAISMSSYFFLIIPAGHETKALTLGMMAPVVGGFFLIFRKKYAWGAALVMLYSSIGLLKHPQMSYYLFMMMGIFGIAEIVLHIKEKKIKQLFVSLAVFAAAMGVGVGSGYSMLKANSEYMSQSIRGGHSDLTPSPEDGNAPASRSKGLDLDYATAWSYGISETMTLLIPNFMGGASAVNVGKNSVLYEELTDVGLPRQNAAEICAAAPTYWGDQPFTAGPVYVGAIVCFLFLLGALVFKGPYKWALIAVTLFSILLSWGRNFMGFTELFFNYFPLYNKFRTVSSILVVAEISMPLLGFLGLNDILKGKVEKRKLLQSIYTSGGVCIALCLFFALFGSTVLPLSGYSDASYSQSPWFVDALVAQRASMLTADSLRSALFVLLAGLALLLFAKGKLKSLAFTAVLGVLVLADMWPVDKRYFGKDNWVSASQSKNYFRMTACEKQILQDSTYFRVMNLSTDTFNDSRTSYYLHSVGGYHAAKLRRYQDLIDEHLKKGNMQAVNMLNTKYFIVNEQGGQQPLLNPDAFGPAWFVDELKAVASANEESAALWNEDLRRTAVCDLAFADFLPGAAEGMSASQGQTAGNGSIELLTYAPDRLVYRSSNDRAQTAVFSEIYYPYGWNAYLDGQKVKHFRADYLLRALNVPAGEHEIVFEFRPDSIYKGYMVNVIVKTLMFAFIICLISGFVLHQLGKGPEWLRRLGAGQ